MGGSWFDSPGKSAGEEDRLPAPDILGLYLKYITNKDLLYRAGNLLNVMWQQVLGGSWREAGYMYVQLSPLAVHLELSQCC